jgi:Rrf2 family protein
MQFNQATDYAFRIIMHLAEMPIGEIVKSQAIAEAQHIPAGFLQKIMRALTQGGIVKSYRGIDGGFSLGKRAVEISLLDVVTIMEGPVDLQRCLKDNSACNKGCAPQCPVHTALAVIQENFTQALGDVNFASLMEINQEER